MADYSLLGERIWSAPTGWYRLGPRPGGDVVLAATIGDLPIVGWEGPDGPVAAVAVCAHLGADLSSGGVARDGCIQCPFHGWRYDADGAHRGTPAGDHVPEARLETLPVRSVGDDLFGFWGRRRPWEPQALTWAREWDETVSGSDEIAEPRVVDRVMGAPPVVVAEGAFDLAHFDAVHGVSPDAVDYGFDGTSAHIRFELGTGRRAFRFTFVMDGLTSLRETVQRDRYTLHRVFSLYAGDGGWRSHVRTSAAGPRAGAAATFVDRLEAAAAADLKADDALWRHRDFVRPSVYGPADRALREFREWALGFYEDAS